MFKIHPSLGWEGFFIYHAQLILQCKEWMTNLLQRRVRSIKRCPEIQQNIRSSGSNGYPTYYPAILVAQNYGAMEMVAIIAFIRNDSHGSCHRPLVLVKNIQ